MTAYLCACVLLVSLACACTGDILAPDLARDPPRSSPFDPIGNTECIPDMRVLRTARIWRLSETQLNHSVRDAIVALGGADPGDGEVHLPLEGSAESTLEQTAARLRLTGTTVELLIDAADRLAEQHAIPLARLRPCFGASGDLEPSCAEDIARTFAEPLFHRQVPPDAIGPYRDQLLAGSTAFGRDGAVKLIFAAMIVSPHSIFRWEEAPEVATLEGRTVKALSPIEIANALSFQLTHRPASRAFADAIAATDLADSNAVEDVVRRHLVGAGRPDGMRDFIEDLFAIGPIHAAATGDPLFTEEVASQLLRESGAWVSELIDQRRASLVGLLEGEFVYVSPETAFIYGLDEGDAPKDLTRTIGPGGQRVGLLAQPAFLATHAFGPDGDPIHRGKVVREHLFCEKLPPPPPEAATILVDTSPNLSNRERFAVHKSGAGCKGCHDVMDEIGFGFEAYDALGRHRTRYANGTWVDETGLIVGTDVPGPFDGPLGLSRQLLSSDQVRRCLSSHVFRFGVGDEATAGDACTLVTLRENFDATTDLVRVVVETVLSPSFRFRE